MLVSSEVTLKNPWARTYKYGELGSLKHSVTVYKQLNSITPLKVKL